MKSSSNISILTGIIITLMMIIMFLIADRRSHISETNSLCKENNKLLLEKKYLKSKLDSLPLGSPLDTIIVNDKFGIRKNPILKIWKSHSGIDLKGTYTDTIYATGSGIVIKAGWKLGYGRCIEIEHIGGYKSLYAHMNKMFVEKKDIVSGRQRIGTVGSTGFSTGPHLHYEVSRYGKITNPKEYLDG